MSYSHVGTLETHPGHRDEVVAILVRSHTQMRDVGCLRYEVGVNDDTPDIVYVNELWESVDAHKASLQLPRVREAIGEAMPHLTGRMTGESFTIVGSPLD